MRRVLNDVVNKILELKTWIGDAMLKLESRVNVLVANCIKSIPEYTYVELKKLKDKGLLIPGQKYKLMDYRCTLSDVPDGLDGSYAVPAHSERHIILAALSKNEFSEDALMPIGEASFHHERIIKYHFERTTYLRWCLAYGEGFKKLKMEWESGQTFNLSYVNTVLIGSLYYCCYSADDGTSYCIRNSTDVWQKYKFRERIDIYDNEANYVGLAYVRDVVEDSFRGIIYYVRFPYVNITLPCDERICFTFDVKGPGAISISGKPILRLSNGPDFSKNVHVEPYTQRGHYYLPRIYISGSAATTQSTSESIIRIESHSTNIVIQGSKCHIGRWCNNLRIYSCHELVVGDGVAESFISTYDGRIAGNCGNLNINAHGIRIGQFNYYLKVVSYSDIVVATNVFYDNNEIFNIEHKDSRRLIIVASDSNGNIRQWNPADFVDAIEPEEQTTETTEE